MINGAIFFKYQKNEHWKFGGFTAFENFEVATFRVENPDGELLMVDLDNLLKSVANPIPGAGSADDVTLDDRVIMTCVHLDDGRIVDVFPASGEVQVYTEDRKRGYELTLPEPEKAYDPVEAGCGLVELRRIS